jgi:hypothetical protein
MKELHDQSQDRLTVQRHDSGVKNCLEFCFRRNRSCQDCDGGEGDKFKLPTSLGAYLYCPPSLPLPGPRAHPSSDLDHVKGTQDS